MAVSDVAIQWAETASHSSAIAAAPLSIYKRNATYTHVPHHQLVP